MGQNIFQISQDIEYVLNELEENGGELTEELANKLEIGEANLKEKLNSYRQACSAIISDIDACKAEEKRIATIRKVKQNNVDRLKSTMLDAVLRFGNEGKSGNRSISLVDSKLYTKCTKSCVIDESLSNILKIIFLDIQKSRYDSDMLDSKYGKVDINVLLTKINAIFVKDYPQYAEDLFKAKGRYFTLDDLLNLNIKFEFNVNITDLNELLQCNLLNAYFDNNGNASAEVNINKTSLKDNIKLDADISFAELEDSQSLVIK